MRTEGSDEDEWAQARRRAAVIARVLPDADPATRLTIVQAARELGVDRATIYRWRTAYDADRRVVALLPRRRGRQIGACIVAAAVEAIIADEIRTFYLTPERPTLAALLLRIRARCHADGLAAPNWRTVKRRADRLDGRKKLAKREGGAVARQRFDSAAGSYSADAPLAVVQIDHTVVDVIVVDEITRQPIDRPVATFAIDVCTRMIVGFYLALDHPSTLRAGVAVAQAVLDKAAWLADRGLDLPWPTAGLPRVVHVDNAGEFRSSTFRHALEDVGVEVVYRPIAQPRYGGHIERLIGTQMGAVHMLPGTTFSDVSARGNYPSEGRATMTVGELERWMAHEILGKYHHRIHSTLKRPPIAVWQEAVAGGVLHQPRRPAEFLASLLPYEWRRVRRDGVHLFGIRYWDEALVPLIGRLEQRLRVKYDPRDLSRVFVQLPDGGHVPIRYADLKRPPISLWERERAATRLRAQGRSELSEPTIFASVVEQRRIEDEARAKSRLARRATATRPAGDRPAAGPGARPTRPLRGIDTGDPDQSFLPSERLNDRWR